MQAKALVRACAALAVYSVGIAVFLVSVIVVILALARSPIFVFVGFGGMGIASLLLQVANTRIAPHHLTTPIIP